MQQQEAQKLLYVPQMASTWHVRCLAAEASASATAHQYDAPKAVLVTRPGCRHAMGTLNLSKVVAAPTPAAYTEAAAHHSQTRPP